MQKTCDVSNFSIFTIIETYSWVPLAVISDLGDNLLPRME